MKNDNTLLVEALKFYANEDNYFLDEKGTVKIMLDGGNIAKMTLKTIKELKDYYDKLDVLSKNLLDSTSKEEYKDIINKIKNLNNISEL